LRENAAALFAESVGCTRRKLEEQLAVRFPRADVRERIARLPARPEIEPLSTERFGIHFTAHRDCAI
jgi:hypothetical protein